MSQWSLRWTAASACILVLLCWRSSVAGQSPNSAAVFPLILNDVHRAIGDQVGPGWPPLEGTAWGTIFSLPFIVDAVITLETAEVQYNDNRVLINGKFVGFLPLNEADSLAPFTMDVPTGVLTVGSNTFRIESARRGTNYDDVRFRNISLDIAPDTDGDGVPDGIDGCPGTAPGDPVDPNGCSPSQVDSDGDGVPDNADQCPGTPDGTAVDSVGCPLLCHLDVKPAWYQKDGAWAGVTYDQTSKTIADKGCALTCLAMALHFITSATSAPTIPDPGWLNAFMNAHKDFQDGVVLWRKTVDDVSQDIYADPLKLEWTGTRISSRVDLTAAKREIRDTVCIKRLPAIVGVKLRPNKDQILVPNHYVLVTGREGDRFTMIDPYDPTIGYLDHYDAGVSFGQYAYHGGFETRGHVVDPAGTSRLEVSATVASFVLVDPFGRRAGLDLASRQDFEDIPGSVHYLDAIQDDVTGELPDASTQTVSIVEPPEGGYRLLATSVEDGLFQILVRALSSDGSEQPSLVLEGHANRGDALTYKIEYSAQPGASPTAVRCEVSFSAPLTVGVTTDPGATACAAVVSDQVLGMPTASGTCSEVTVHRQDLPAGNVFPVGMTTISYTAEDELGNTAVASQLVSVRDATPPLLNSPPDIDTQTDPGAAHAVLDPGRPVVSDNCVATTLEAVRSDGLPVSAAYPIGTTTITWTSTDIAGNMASGRQAVVVRDAESPAVVGVAVDESVLWPPNHRMVDVMVSYAARDNSGATPVCRLNVASDEPIDGVGDGDSAPDWIVVDAHRVRLRAERSGGGNGRRYDISITCTDTAGNAATHSVAVSVPKDQR